MGRIFQTKNKIIMRRFISFFILQLFIINGCSSQERFSEVDFFKYVDAKSVMISIYDTLGQKIVILNYEFEFSKLKVGDAYLCAISKKYPEEWIKKAKESECATREDEYTTIWCQAEHLFREDTVLLKESFDIYVFFIDKKELEGPFREQTDEGYYDNYFPKKNSNIIVYRYNKGKWVEIQRIKNPNGDIPRFVGEDYMDKLAQQKIKEYLKNR